MLITIFILTVQNTMTLAYMLTAYSNTKYFDFSAKILFVFLFMYFTRFSQKTRYFAKEHYPVGFTGYILCKIRSELYR